MNGQEIFDKVARHLLTQGVRSSRGSNTCVYRGPNGTMCAVGCLLPDDVAKAADSKFLSVTGLINHDMLPAELRPHALLLERLQHIHDSIDVAKWREELTRCAEQYKLSAAAVAS